MEFKNNQAIYVQIMEYAFEQILLDKWPKDQKVFSVRELAVRLEVNPNTVMRAYEQMQQLEIIYNKRGLGFYVSSDAVNKIKIYRRKQFLENELPELFKNIYLLEVPVEDILERYKIFVKNYKLENL